MEFLVVSKRKLKVILDKSEVEKYCLSDFSSGDSVELRKRLAEVLLEAKRRVDFDSVGERLLVSYYPTRLAGAELFVTVIGADCEKGVKLYYIFNGLKALSTACRAAEASVGESTVYLLPNGEYCLSLVYRDGAPEIVTEFSTTIPEEIASVLLAHSRRLDTDNAVSVFAKL